MKTIAIKKVKTRVSYEDTYGSRDAGQYMSIFELLQDLTAEYEHLTSDSSVEETLRYSKMKFSSNGSTLK